MNRMKEKIVEEYWLKKLSGDLPKVSLPLITTGKEKDAGAREIKRAQHHLEEIPIPVSARLIKTARNSDIALFILVLSGLNIVLTRYTGTDDLVVGTIPPAAHGNGNQAIFCRSQILNGITIKEFIAQTKDDVLKAINYSGYPPDDLVEMLRTRNNTDAVEIFNAAFIYEPFQKKNQYLDRFDLLVTLSSNNGGLHLQIKYPGPPGSHEIIKGFSQNLITTLEYILDNPTQEIDLVNILSPLEKDRLLYDFNRTGTGSPQDKPLHRLFEEQAKKTPHYTALLGLHDTRQAYEKNYNMSHYLSHMSYKELNEKSNRLAIKLMEQGVKPGTIVGILVGRSIEMITGLLAILKTGAAYLPLDPEYPGMRIHYILENSNVGILVTTPKLQVKVKAEVEGNARQPGLPPRLIPIYTDPALALEPSSSTLTSTLTSTCRVSPANPAYVIYTSGSTGNPKGVVIQHQNAVNFIAGMAAVIDFSPGKTILALTTISFDIFFLETLLPITRGLKVVIADENQQKNPALLQQLILNTRVNMVQFTPSRLQLLLDLKGNLQGLTGVKELMVGGEAFPGLLLEKVKKHFQGKIFNMYGPTETTIWSTVKELTHTLPGEITIGTPIANTRVYIVDRNNHPQPLGVTGELLIGGDGTALGYLNNVELTAEKFDHDLWDLQDYHDFQKQETSKKVPGQKDYRSYKSYKSYALYKTGDLARWLSNGEIEFLGRLDHQVKIRGFRIELEEIEEQLLKQEHIKEAVVVVKTDASGHKNLCAYIVPQSGDSSEPPDTTILREQLSIKLPSYMIPAYFVHLEKMPLTPNGKMDRKALPEPDLTRSQPGNSGTFVAPDTENEKLIAGIWKEILHIEEVSIHDNFFDLGANSMHVSQLNWKLKETFGKEIPLTLMFRNLSISFLDHYLSEEETGKETEKIIKQTEILDRDQETLKDTISKLTGM